VNKYLIYDGHGSTRQLQNSTETIVENYNYDAYGIMLQEGTVNPAATTPVQGTSLLYAGEMYDFDMQHYYNRARWYNPYNGRFNRTDPFAGNNQDPQSLHKYLYAHANPVNRYDPSGNFSIIGTALNLLSAVNIGLITTSIASKVYRIGMGFKELSVLSELMVKLSQTQLDAMSQIQIRNHVFLVALSIIKQMGDTAISLLKEVISTVAFAVATVVVIAAVSGLIKATAGGVSVRLSKFLEARKMAKVRKIGQLGEDAAGIVAKNKRQIKSLTGKANYRIPDELTDFHLREVKNRAHVGFTSQIDDYFRFARSKNLDFILDVRRNSRISETLLELEDKGLIIIRRYL